MNLADRPFRVLLIAGSERRQYNCPGVDSKARTLMLRMADALPQEWEIDWIDLGNVFGEEKIQSCNACVSTSMALCCWPCNCYEKDHKKEPDMMWNNDLYARLDAADAWAIIAPVNWYGPTSNIKLMFDRLVCMNGGNPRAELIDHKNPDKAMALEHSAQWEKLSVNHLEGRTAGFFVYGDGGADEADKTGRPKILRHKEWFNPDEEPFDEERDTYAPIVWQCRYSGIEVPDKLWMHCTFGAGEKYSDNQAEDIGPKHPNVYAEFDSWVKRFTLHVAEKGKVPPGEFRAWGYDAPSHRIDDVRLGWRYLKMKIGVAPEGSSAQIQQDRGLSRDTYFGQGRNADKA